MAYKFPSKEWTDAFARAVNDNEAYKQHGKPWVFGAVAMVVRKNSALGIEEDTGLVIDVHEGSCRGATFGPSSEVSKTAAFVIVADYPRWKEVIEGSLDPIKGMMEGKLKLTVGHLPTMIRFVESSRALVRSAAAVPTEFLG
ncbi:MAG: SCP2 sterol-binding domain-containing protein, partial [Polyangiaceae bacterium]|nr:SCP2 sterol-binding domain-containing protein [Polyangiaceae bacterium]